MAARWAELGVDRLERRLVGIDRDGPAHGRAHRVRHRGRDRRPARGRLHAAWPTAASPSSETATLPDDLADLARVGTVLEVVSGPEDLRWFGTGPHETYPDRQARRAWSASGSRPSPTSTSRTSARRRTAATPTSAGSSSRDAAGAGLPDRARRAPPGVGDPPARRRPGRRRPTTSTSCPSPETVIHLDAAHRGLGTASCGPDTLPEYRLGARHATAGPGPCATSDRADRCRSHGRRTAREFHLRNDLISYVVGVNANGSLGHRYFGPALAGRPDVRPHRDAGVRRLRQPRRRPGRARIPDDGVGRLPGAGLDRRAGRRLGRPRPRLRRAPDPCRQAGPSAGGRPPGDLRRVRRGGGNARDRPRRRAQRPRGRAVVHDLRATGPWSPGARGSATTGRPPSG